MGSRVLIKNHFMFAFALNSLKLVDLVTIFIKNHFCYILSIHKPFKLLIGEIVRLLIQLLKSDGVLIGCVKEPLQVLIA